MTIKKSIRLKKIKQKVIERDGLICCFCNKVLNLNTVTMEHIVPESLRGTFNKTNLTVSCEHCNSARGNQNFFDFCKNYNFSNQKLEKYKKLYFNNLKIKVLNIAKDVCLTSAKSESVIPSDMINQACNILKIQNLYYNKYIFDIPLHKLCSKRVVRNSFEKIIKQIDGEIV